MFGVFCPKNMNNHLHYIWLYIRCDIIRPQKPQGITVCVKYPDLMEPPFNVSLDSQFNGCKIQPDHNWIMRSRRLFKRSGPVLRKEYKLLPFNVAAASLKTLPFPDLFGLRTVWCSRNHVVGVMAAASESAICLA